MPTIFDMFYREYCRARLAEMRKQLLIPTASDEIPEARSNSGDPGGPRSSGYWLARGSRDEDAQR